MHVYLLTHTALWGSSSPFERDVTAESAILPPFAITHNALSVGWEVGVATETLSILFCSIIHSRPYRSHWAVGQTICLLITGPSGTIMELYGFTLKVLH